MPLRVKIICLILFLVLVISCTTIRTTRPSGPVQTGTASWYGPNFHGKQTSSKEIYNMYDLTAAHKTLPFGTQVMVTNLNNKRSVKVRINDRGPFVKGRIIDLSYAAARVLDMIGSGTAPVRLEILNASGTDMPTVRYAVQAGSFISKPNARSLASRLKRKYRGVYLQRYPTRSQVYWRVRIQAKSREHAESLARRMESEGYPVFIVED